MWLFTRHGFYSVVRDKHHSDKVNVRARRIKHLKALIERFDLRDCKILSSGVTDYRHRIIIPFKTWKNIGAMLTADIDYTNFKNETRDDKEYHSAAVKVWTTMFHYQMDEHFKGV